MDISQKMLSDVVVFNKYSKFLEDFDRRENWQEVCDRYAQMHIEKYPQLTDKIVETVNNFILPKTVLPSMRGLQFAGKAIEANNSRLYNCSALAVDSHQAFSEMLFLSLGGTGVGFSVQKQHIAQLPRVYKPTQKIKFVINDTIMGWADAVKVLVKSYFFQKPLPIFDFRDIRPKGSPLKTAGGLAPGHKPLEIALNKLKDILDSVPAGSRLSSIQCHDMMCFLADSVLSAGIRRSACISLFSMDDELMLACKAGDWWEKNPQRGRANNSAVVHRPSCTEEMFKVLWGKMVESGSGDPGIFFVNSKESLTNPCCEIFLRPNQFCNLTTLNPNENLLERSAAASFLGTLQAGYTDFNYLRPSWKETTEKEALLGVSQTGVASHLKTASELKAAADLVVSVNKETAALIGINQAARTTCIKPEGSTSCVLGTSSGIHDWHFPHYIRRVGINKSEPLYKYLLSNHPHLLENDYFNPEAAHLLFPQKTPSGAKTGSTSMELLNRVKHYSDNWVKPGHVAGEDTHNVSCTISVKGGDWEETGKWMWENRYSYNGIAVFPFFGGSHKHLPFEQIEEDRYKDMMSKMKDINLAEVVEESDNTLMKESIACAGGACEVV